MVKLNKKNVLIALLVLIVIAVALFFKMDGFEKIRHAYYGYKVQNMYSTEFNKFETQLARFGFSDTNAPKADCRRTEIASYEGEQLLCVSANQQYVVIGNDKATKEDFVIKAKELDALLAQNGWTTFSNSAKSFEEWMKAVTSGVDYNTDINSNFTSKDGVCGISMTVAYSNPAPPAVNTQLICNSPDYPGNDGESIPFQHTNDNGA